MSEHIDIDGQQIPIKLRWNAQARRLILRLDSKGDGVVVTLPKGVHKREGLNLVQKHQVWIANQLLKQPDTLRFQAGTYIPLRGVPHLIVHHPEERGTVWLDNNELHVAGQTDFLARRLGDWLKKQARIDITAYAHPFAEQLGKKISRISIRDTVSRWGSCSSKGNLNFNWRLIMAPSEILEYVVAHEVAHLRHMDHSPAFWATVEELGVNAKAARHWLKKNGTALQQAG